jgi:MFS family permease
MAEIAPAHRRPTVNGFRWALMSVVSATLVVAFGYLLERMAFPINYQSVFFVSFLGAAASILVFSRIRLRPCGRSSEGEGGDEPPLACERPGDTGKRSLARKLREYVGPFLQTPAFVRYLLAAFVLRLGMHLPAALYSIYWVRNLDASDAQIGWQATAADLARIFGFLIWGRIATRRGHSSVLALCTIGVGAYPLFTGLISTPLWLPLAATVYGFSLPGIRIAFLDTLLQVCPVDRRPSFVAANFLLSQFTLFLAPLVGSLLVGWFDIRVVLFVASGIHLLAFLLFRLLRVGDGV